MIQKLLFTNTIENLLNHFTIFQKISHKLSLFIVEQKESFFNRKDFVVLENKLLRVFYNRICMFGCKYINKRLDYWSMRFILSLKVLCRSS